MTEYGQQRTKTISARVTMLTGERMWQWLFSDPSEPGRTESHHLQDASRAEIAGNRQSVRSPSDEHQSMPEIYYG